MLTEWGLYPTDSSPELAELVRYGVRGLAVGGCVEGITAGRKGAMRRFGHAHCRPKDETTWLGWICMKGLRRLYRQDGRWSWQVWHEVAHVWRRSWTEAQCTAWARKQVQADRT